MDWYEDHADASQSRSPTSNILSLRLLAASVEPPHCSRHPWAFEQLT
jgi:hypothetical protein